MKASGQNWLSGWQYRKSHVINKATDAGTNYQVKIVAHYNTGTDNDSDVYLNTHARNDFGDVRFTGSDGSTLLDYWMESKVDSDNAVFWVEVADDLSTNAVTIYVYYGNANATTTSNGANTFLFFDDFSSATETLTFSGVGSWSRDTVNGWLVHSGGGGDAFATKDIGVTNVRVLTKCYYVTSAANKMGTTLRFTDTNNWYLELTQGGSQNFWGIGKKVAGTWSFLTSVSYTPVLATWYKIDSRVYSTTLRGKIDTTDISATDSSFTTQTKHGLFANAASGNTIRFDYIAIAKYVYPEPSHGSWGSEETWNWHVAVGNPDISWGMIFLFFGIILGLGFTLLKTKKR